MGLSFPRFVFLAVGILRRTAACQQARDARQAGIGIVKIFVTAGSAADAVIIRESG
jgi:hypothetical protein